MFQCFIDLSISLISSDELKKINLSIKGKKKPECFLKLIQALLNNLLIIRFLY
jgi:hypothetical protein